MYWQNNYLLFHWKILCNRKHIVLCKNNVMLWIKLPNENKDWRLFKIFRLFFFSSISQRAASHQCWCLSGSAQPAETSLGNQTNLNVRNEVSYTQNSSASEELLWLFLPKPSWNLLTLLNSLRWGRPVRAALDVWQEAMPFPPGLHAVRMFPPADLHPEAICLCQRPAGRKTNVLRPPVIEAGLPFGKRTPLNGCQ